jgi:hypothetical protein
VGQVFFFRRPTKMTASIFNPFELQNDTWERSDISIGAKSMLNRLRNAAGKKGKIQLRVEKWGKWVGYEKRMAQYLIAELITAGLVKREAVRGHANYWIITDVYGKYQTHATHCTTVKEQDLRKENVQGNAISSQSSKPFDLPLVNRIIAETGDKKSTKYWIMIVRKLPEAEILQYLSHLKIAMNEKIIHHPGAYLNSLILANHPELRRATPTSTPQTPPHYIEPEDPKGTPASEEVVKAYLAEIKAKLYRKVG